MRLSLLASALTLLTLACGQDVPTCDSDCTMLGSPVVVLPNDGHYNGYAPLTAACSSTCEADEATATASGHAADFQALLTCVGNAGSFAAECAPLACGFTSAFGVPTGCSK